MKSLFISSYYLILEHIINRIELTLATALSIMYKEMAAMVGGVGLTLGALGVPRGQVGESWDEVFPEASGQASCCSLKCSQQDPHPFDTLWYHLPLSWSLPSLSVLEVLPQYSGGCWREMGFSTSVLDSVRTHTFFFPTKGWNLALRSLNLYKLSFICGCLPKLCHSPYGSQEGLGPPYQFQLVLQPY